MTIVELSNLDTFIRDSLYEVRRGIANSRNTTQSNPMLGVMVDLPEKIDFEIVVASDYQLLSRATTTSDIQSGGDLIGSTKRVISSDISYGLELSNEKSADNELVVEQNQTVSKEATKETFSSNSAGIEADGRRSGENETEFVNGTETSTEKKNGNESSKETTSEKTTDTSSTSSTVVETETKSGSTSKTDTSSSSQNETHLEANDRASKSFDEDDGTWGSQGQLSTPKLPGTPCSC